MGIIFMDLGQGGWKIEKSEESQDLHSLILSVCGESPHYQFAVSVLACGKGFNMSWSFKSCPVTWICCKNVTEK